MRGAIGKGGQAGDARVAVDDALVVVAVAEGIAESVGVTSVRFVEAHAEFIDSDTGVLDVAQFAADITRAGDL